MGHPTILLVVQSREVAEAVIPWLQSADYELVVVDSFLRAKVYLDLQPDLLVTELRLGEYNGLHLALRGQATGLPAVVIGEPDSVLENDARKLGAIYVRKTELVREHLLALLSTVLQSHPRQYFPTSDLAWVDRADWQEALTGRMTTAVPGKNWPLYH
jgi:DNA-binding response OmpR family regulator